MRIFLLAGLLTYATARLIETFRKRGKVKGRVIAPYTLHFLVIGHVVVFLLALHDVLNRPVQFTIINVVGILLVAIAAIARFYSVKTLGVYHSIQIEIRQNHPVISNGPYWFSRNPYYLSNAIEVVGFPVAVNSLLGATVALLIYWPCLYLRLVLEERALLEASEVAFSQYMRRVPRFIPSPFRVGGRV